MFFHLHFLKNKHSFAKMTLLWRAQTESASHRPSQTLTHVQRLLEAHLLCRPWNWSAGHPSFWDAHTVPPRLPGKTMKAQIIMQSCNTNTLTHSHTHTHTQCKHLRPPTTNALQEYMVYSFTLFLLFSCLNTGKNLHKWKHILYINAKVRQGM